MDLLFGISCVIIAVFVGGWLLQNRKVLSTTGDPTTPKSLEDLFDSIDTTPDKPINFGYKMSWLAVRSLNAQDVIRSLAIDNLQRANWRTGVVAAYNGHAFISPAINGWVFVVTSKLPELGHTPDNEEWTSLMQALSREFGEVQYFGTHRVVGYNAWARFTNGAEERAFAYLGESGETLADRGSQNSGEAELGYNYFDPDSPDAESESYWEREELCYPEEEHVMEVAGKWSINPNTLESMDLPADFGWIGNIRRQAK
ncbi:MAG: hypothetical protein WEB58_16795 [Planctomycetaceae bacterium]